MANSSIYDRLLKFQSYYSFLGKEFVSDISLNDENLVFSSEQECYKNFLKKLKKAIRDEINRQYQVDPNKLFSNMLDSLLKNGDFRDDEKIKVLHSVIKSIGFEIPNKMYDFLINDSFLKGFLNNLFSSLNSDKLYSDYPALKNLFDKYLRFKNRNDDFKRKNDLLSYEDVKELYRRIGFGDNSAKEVLINKNLRLVQKIAASILRKYRVSSLTFEDLCQEGTIGLMKAIDRYDPEKGFLFSTYACSWIKQRMLRAIDNYDKMIRVPVRYNKIYSDISKKIDDLETKLRRKATYDEIKSMLGMSDNYLKQYYDTPTKFSSLNVKVNGDDSDELEKFIGEEVVFGNNVDDKLNKENFINFLKNNLNDEEFDIIVRRFGVVDKECNTLDFIAKSYNTTRENIRIKQNRILRSLSSNPIFVEFLIEGNYLLDFNKLKEVCDGRLLAYTAYRTGLVGGIIRTPNELVRIFSEKKVPVLEKKAETVLRKNSKFQYLYARYNDFYKKEADEVVDFTMESSSNSKNKSKKINNFDYVFNEDIFSLTSVLRESNSLEIKNLSCFLTDEVLISIKPYLVQIRDNLTELIPLVNEENCEFLLGEVKKLTMTHDSRDLFSGLTNDN